MERDGEQPGGQTGEAAGIGDPAEAGDDGAGDDGADAPAEPGGPLGQRGNGKRWGRGGASGFSGWVAAAAIVAAIAGTAAGFFLIRGAPVAIAAGGATPSASAPTSSGNEAGLPTLPGLPGSTHSTGDVKIGDEVAAQITGTPSHPVITTLQDPAELPEIFMITNDSVRIAVPNHS